MHDIIHGVIIVCMSMHVCPSFGMPRILVGYAGWSSSHLHSPKDILIWQQCMASQILSLSSTPCSMTEQKCVQICEPTSKVCLVLWSHLLPFTVTCNSQTDNVQPKVRISWILQKIHCMEEMYLPNTRVSLLWKNHPVVVQFTCKPYDDDFWLFTTDSSLSDHSWDVCSSVSTTCSWRG